MKMNYNNDEFPRWFTIVFPAMIELAQEVGLTVDFDQGSSDIFSKRQQIIQT